MDLPISNESSVYSDNKDEKDEVNEEDEEYNELYKGIYLLIFNLLLIMVYFNILEITFAKLTV